MVATGIDCDDGPPPMYLATSSGYDVVQGETCNTECELALSRSVWRLISVVWPCMLQPDGPYRYAIARQPSRKALPFYFFLHY